MSSKIDTTSFDQMMKDLFPKPGEPMKQWVLDARAARRELERTGKRVAVPPHRDNTDIDCRNVGDATLVYDLEHHDCCHVCNELGEASR